MKQHTLSYIPSSLHIHNHKPQTFVLKAYPARECKKNLLMTSWLLWKHPHPSLMSQCPQQQSLMTFRHGDWSPHQWGRSHQSNDPRCHSYRDKMQGVIYTGIYQKLIFKKTEFELDLLWRCEGLALFFFIKNSQFQLGKYFSAIKVCF